MILFGPFSLHYVVEVLMMATISYDLLQDCSAASLQPILSHYKNVVLTGLMVTHSAGHGRHVGV